MASQTIIIELDDLFWMESVWDQPHSQSVTNIQVGQEFVSWSNVSLTNIFVNWLTFNNGIDQDVLVKC